MSTLPNHDQQAHHDDHRGPNTPGSHAEAARHDDLPRSHGVKHHLRNSGVSAQEALRHARDALQQLAASAQASSQPVATDLKNVLNELDHALHALRHESGEQVLHLRDALQDYAVRIRQIARDGVTQVRDAAASGVEHTQQRVIKDPLKSVGLAAGLGVVLGLWLGHCARAR